MRSLLSTILGNCFNVGCALVIILCQRYLLGLSTWKQDRLWLERQAWYNNLQRLRYYRGSEVLHQVNFWRIVGM